MGYGGFLYSYSNSFASVIADSFTFSNWHRMKQEEAIKSLPIPWEAEGSGKSWKIKIDLSGPLVFYLPKFRFKEQCFPVERSESIVSSFNHLAGKHLGFRLKLESFKSAIGKTVKFKDCFIKVDVSGRVEVSGKIDHLKEIIADYYSRISDYKLII